MEKRQIKMQDGRYLIFYTFTNVHQAPSGAEVEENQQGDNAASQPEAKPEAGEERHV